MIASILFAALIQNDAYRLSASIESGEEKGRPVFILTGSSDLPDGALVFLDLYRAGDHEGAQLFGGAARVVNGKYREIVAVFETKNPCGKYVLRARFDAAFQDRRDVGAAVSKSAKSAAVNAEARLQLGTPQELEREYRSVCERLGRELDEILGLVSAARGRPRADLPAWKEEMDSVKRRILEIERRNIDRAEYRFYGLTSIACGGLEELRGAACEAIDAFLRAAASTPGKASSMEREAALRFDSLARLVDRHKSTLQIPRATLDTVRELLKRLQSVEDCALKAYRSDEPAFVRARIAAEHRNAFEAILVDLATALPDEQYSQVSDLAEAARALFDRIAEPAKISSENAPESVALLQDRLEKLLRLTPR